VFGAPSGRGPRPLEKEVLGVEKGKKGRRESGIELYHMRGVGDRECQGGGSAGNSLRLTGLSSTYLEKERQQLGGGGGGRS